jgi:hypothetical protein
MSTRWWIGAVALMVSCSVVNAPDDPQAADEDEGEGGNGASGASGGAGACGPLDTVDNCGECGNACTPMNADAACEDGECGYADCDAGFADCNDDRADGCESHSATDPMNCSGCGMSCEAAPFMNVETLLCDAGMCDWLGCDPGFDDCNGVPGDGCEEPVDTIDSCGACGVPCTPANVLMAECPGGHCGYTGCATDFLDCDSNTMNGCETDRLTDEAHCGACNMPCDPGETCTNGACAACLNGDPVVNGFCQPQAICGLAPASIFCGGNCSNNNAQYATWYCQLAGYSAAASYNVLTSGTVTCYYYNGGQAAVLSMCSQVMAPTSYGLAATCDAVTNLLCVP